MAVVPASCGLDTVGLCGLGHHTGSTPLALVAYCTAAVVGTLVFPGKVAACPGTVVSPVVLAYLATASGSLFGEPSP